MGRWPQCEFHTDSPNKKGPRLSRALFLTKSINGYGHDVNVQQQQVQLLQLASQLPELQ
jgi:hypothetical protein